MKEAILKVKFLLLLLLTGVARAADFYVDSHSEAQKWVAAHPTDGRVSDINSHIAQQPAARWFTGDSTDIDSAVSTYAGRAASAGRTPVLVAYNIPHRDCGGASAGGAASASAYKAWISSFASALGTGAAVVVLEPDALAQLTSCGLSSRDQSTRLSLLAYATQQFKTNAPSAKVYIDIGHDGWLAEDVAAERLEQAGIKNVHGFSLNVSSFQTTALEVTYGKAIAATLLQDGYGAKTFVIDTSRNGNGPPSTAGTFCNPDTRKIGAPPSVSAVGTLPEMRLWVKNPGLSDGECGASSAAAGIFDPELAYKLVHGL